MPTDTGARQPNTIRVGVRSDARPFSYQGKTGANETILPNYRGYMVEICRRVLRQVVKSGPFRGYRVQGIEIESASRFEDLESGRLDLLCGPDSITSARLRRHNVSHPLFLSGMTYGYVDPKSGKFPRSNYCGNIVGVVRGTTAASVGLEMLAEQNLLLRFDQALELYLAKSPGRLQSILRVERDITEREMAARPMLQNMSRVEVRKRLNHLIEPEIVKIQTDLRREILTDECPAPEGFKNGLPVRLFNSHDEGIDDFCSGHILYYIGDYDIIQRKIAAHSNCPVLLERFTQTREIYAVFFRASFTDTDTDAGAGDGEALTRQPGTKHLVDTNCPACTIDASLLYAVFNHTLLQMMQANINILDIEFRREFGDAAKSEDLQQFFDGFKVASDM